jgi:Flp pilus assembly protein TadB
LIQKEKLVDNDFDEELRRKLQSLAREPLGRQIPTAPESWSRVQFRLRHQFGRHAQVRASILVQLIVGICSFILVIQLANIPQLTFGLVPILAIAIFAAFVLCVVTHRTVRS